MRILKPLSILMLSAMSWASQAQISPELLNTINNQILGGDSSGYVNVADAEITQRLNALRYVDIRDLNKYDTEIAGSSGKIMEAMKEAPGRFVGRVTSRGEVIEDNTHIKFLTSGAKGPNGTVNKSTNFFKASVAEDNQGTRVNSILGATVERAIQIKNNKPAYLIDLALFVHDQQRDLNVGNQYYFRRVSVIVDWNIDKTNLREMVKVVKADQDVSLADTNFRVVGDLLERKIILDDQNYGFRRVFPIGVGGFIFHTAPGMNPTIYQTYSRTTGQTYQRAALQTDEFPYSHMKSVKETKDSSPSGPNTRARYTDSYFRGRPFLSLYFKDTNTELDVAFHYQIDSDLTRGFVSHGCIRVRDMDLYIMDAILNDGPQMRMPAHVVYDLGKYGEFSEFLKIDHPMPKKNSSYKVRVFSANAYTPGEVDGKVDCTNFKKRKATRKVDYVGGGYHDIIDSDCLSANVSSSSYRLEDATVAINYMKGLSSELPHTPIDNNMPHYNYTYDIENGYGQQQQMQPGYQVDEGAIWGFETNNNNNGWGVQQNTTRQRGSAAEINEAQNNVNTLSAWVSQNCNAGLFNPRGCKDRTRLRDQWIDRLNYLLGY